MQFCTLARARYHPSCGQIDDALLIVLLEAASDKISQLCGNQNFAYTVVTDEYLHGNGGSSIWVGQVPVQSITALSIINGDGTSTVIDLLDVDFCPGTGEVRIQGGAVLIPEGWRNVKISYTAGYGDVVLPVVPEPIIEATILLALAIAESNATSNTLRMGAENADYRSGLRERVNKIGIPKMVLDLIHDYMVPPAWLNNWITTVNGTLTSYSPSSLIPGPQGPQGLWGTQGSQGWQGRIGVQGVDGRQGAQGRTGPQGIQGPQGVIGPQGLLGMQGSQGLRGLQGFQGSQGLVGTQGVQGRQGIDGSQGSQGNQGLRGFQGLVGNQGSQGWQGNQGWQGARGFQGFWGYQGAQGNQGWQGYQGIGTDGVQGAQGPSEEGTQGPQGIEGTDGNQGPQGDLGTDGAQGFQGDLGTDGVQGPQGDLGTDGVQGPQGSQGDTGPQGLTGVQGWQGENPGAQGSQGSQGWQGRQGWQGVEDSTPRAVGITIDGGGAVITTGVKGYVQVPFAGTLSRWTLLADVVGDLVIDVWSESYADAPPTVADTIASNQKPTLSGVIKNELTALTNWTTAVTAGDVFGFNVDSATTVTRATLILWIDT